MVSSFFTDKKHELQTMLLFAFNSRASIIMQSKFALYLFPSPLISKTVFITSSCNRTPGMWPHLKPFEEFPLFRDRFESFPRQASAQIMSGTWLFWCLRKTCPLLWNQFRLSQRKTLLCLRTVPSPTKITPLPVPCDLSGSITPYPTPLLGLATGYSWIRGKVSRNEGTPFSIR